MPHVNKPVKPLQQRRNILKKSNLLKTSLNLTALISTIGFEFREAPRKTVPRQQPVAADASKEQKEPEVLGFRAWFRALALGFKSVPTLRIN